MVERLLAVSCALRCRCAIGVRIGERMYEVPFLFRHFRDAEPRHLKRLHVFEDSAGFGIFLKLFQGHGIVELAAKLHVDDTPFGLVARRLLVIVRMLLVECRLCADA